MLNKIVIVSSGQPSSNPRALKEAIFLSQKKLDVTFIYCPISEWANEFDKKVIEENSNINFICTGFQKNTSKYTFARVRKKFWVIASKFFKNLFDANLKSTALFSQELVSETAKHKADLYIAHNLAAIAAVVKAAKLYNASAGFDAEDFHRGESLINSTTCKVIAQIEDKYFPYLNYCTVASPLIGIAYTAIFPKINFTVINNVFSIKHLSPEPKYNNNDELNLFWFSQYIGTNRGLETIIDALNICNNKSIKLHLLGNITNEYKDILISKSKILNCLNFISATHPNNIFDIAQKMDIGLATEIANSENRNICLTNKIFTYLLAGNAIVFSNTKAQKTFLNENKRIGLLFKSNDSLELSKIFTKLAMDKMKLYFMKTNAWQLAKEKYNWEKESEMFYSLILKLI